MGLIFNVCIFVLQDQRHDEMMEDVLCSSGDQLDSVDNLLFCSVNSEPSIKRRSVVKCASTLRLQYKCCTAISATKIA